MNLQKEHNKLYTRKPKVLIFVCEYCDKRYCYEFSNPNDDILWDKELKEIKCPHCKKKRI